MPNGAPVKLARAFVASLCGLAFAGCVISGPEIRVKPPIEVRAEPASPSKFCPPGQAKKGNC
jgi:hypothetical protein